MQCVFVFIQYFCEKRKWIAHIEVFILSFFVGLCIFCWCGGIAANGFTTRFQNYFCMNLFFHFLYSFQQWISASDMFVYFEWGPTAMDLDLLNNFHLKINLHCWVCFRFFIIKSFILKVWLFQKKNEKRKLRTDYDTLIGANPSLTNIIV